MIKPMQTTDTSDCDLIPVIAHRWFAAGADWAFNPAYEGRVLDASTALKTQLQKRSDNTFVIRWRDGYLIGVQAADPASPSLEAQDRRPTLLAAAYATRATEVAYLRSLPRKNRLDPREPWEPGEEFTRWLHSALSAISPATGGSDENLAIAVPTPMPSPPPMLGRYRGLIPAPAKKWPWTALGGGPIADPWTAPELACELESTLAKVLGYWNDDPLSHFLADGWFGVDHDGRLVVSGGRPSLHRLTPFTPLRPGTLDAEFVNNGLIVVVGRTGTLGGDALGVHSYAFHPNREYWQMASAIHCGPAVRADTRG